MGPKCLHLVVSGEHQEMLLLWRILLMQFFNRLSRLCT